MTQFIEAEQAKIIVNRMNEDHAYIEGKGCRCPLCGAWGERTCMRIVAGKQIRYYRCPVCRFRFSAK